MESSIESLREEINRIDESIIKLLSARMEVAKKIAFLKKEMGILVEDRDLSLIHISEPTRLLSISYAVFCLKKKKTQNKQKKQNTQKLIRKRKTKKK